MKKFYECIVNHTKLILTVFAVLFVICLICKPFISVDYDMNDYLPPESPSTTAMDVMDAEYDGGIPNARVMLENVSIADALKYKEAIKNVDGV